jgi:hypothetical protein
MYDNEKTLTQDAQNVQTSHPPSPGAPRGALSRARPQRVKDRRVPSGAHGATKKEHHVCARRRVVRRLGPREGSERCENAAGGLFQHPAR